MVGRLIQIANSADQYPPIFKQLWHTPLVQSPDQEIVYRDGKHLFIDQIPKASIGNINKKALRGNMAICDSSAHLREGSGE